MRRAKVSCWGSNWAPLSLDSQIEPYPHRLNGTVRNGGRRVPRSPEEVGFAPSEGECVSRAGRTRKDHARDKDGRCVYCDHAAD